MFTTLAALTHGFAWVLASEAYDPVPLQSDEVTNLNTANGSPYAAYDAAGAAQGANPNAGAKRGKHLLTALVAVGLLAIIFTGYMGHVKVSCS